MNEINKTQPLVQQTCSPRIRQVTLKECATPLDPLLLETRTAEYPPPTPCSCSVYPDLSGLQGPGPPDRVSRWEDPGEIGVQLGFHCEVSESKDSGVDSS